jgi:hypothetical protein
MFICVNMFFFFFWQMQSDLEYPNGDYDAITIRKHDYKTQEPK